ncbi:MAG: hypothetical protein K9N23_15375 [Akkermansiaceae bacterium]|nr:hypothetical protein [Akkermansiaceae bacterium]
MKPSTTDYLSITAALVAILLCGYGIGFLIGERTTRQRLLPQPGTVQSQPDWSATTVERLTRELKLTPDQQTAVAREIDLTSGTIAAARQQAIREYQLALIDLHQRLLPHLDRAQRKKIEKSCAKLKLLLDNPDGSGE